MEKLRVVIVMGVAGSGKSTVGALLAERHRGVFHDADAFHPPANVAKMASGKPLDDADRAPWLDRLKLEVVDAAQPGRLTVLACSALKRAYRDRLGVGNDGVSLVYLRGDEALLTSRLGSREGHFMKAGMLASQLATLEEPLAEEGIIIDIDAPVEEILMRIESALGLRFPG